MKTKIGSLLVLSITCLAACGSSGSGGTGTAGTGGGAGTTGTAGTTGDAGTTGTAGTTGSAGTTGTAGTTGDAGTTGTAGTTGSAGTTGAAGAGACNTLLPTGQQIAKTTHAGPPPAMTGGAIVAGTYVLTAMDKYNNKQGSNTHRETWVFTATHVEVVSEDSDTGAQHFSGDYSVAGNVLTFTITCPAGAGTMHTLYTSAGGNIMTGADPATTDEEVHTITKQ